MKLVNKIAALGLTLLWVACTWGQIRNVTINTNSEEGKFLQQASDQTDPAKKIALLEEFLTKYPSHEAVDYVHLQLQAEYLKVNNFDKSIENGLAVQAKAPDDLEVAHLMVKGAEGKGDPVQLAAAVEKAHALAQKAAAAPKPSSDTQAEAWQRSIDLAKQVEDYNQYALYNAAQKQATPQGKAVVLDTLRKDFPGGQFAKTVDAQLIAAYQQAGDNAKMLEVMQAALANDPTNENYLFVIAANSLDPAKGKLDVAQANAQKILQTLPDKPKPANMSDEEWAKSKSNYIGLAHSVLGRALANQNQFAPAEKELLIAAADLKGNDQPLAEVIFYLGFVAAKQEHRRDAINYLTQASKIQGPYQAPATDLLNKIRAAAPKAKKAQQ
jgi:tetratricopeptide (TPR) repeat protein